MLLSMQSQLQNNEPSTAATNFAGVLSEFTAPGSQAAPTWIDRLDDDVATLSYKHALEKQARRGTDASDASSREPRCGVQKAVSPAGVRGEPRKAKQSTPAQTAAADSLNSAHVTPLSSAIDPKEICKRASVSIRMSKVEVAQLKQRAAEADLTVSAYLRSCAFEVETLRTQVKQTLAELRSQQTTAPSGQQTDSWWFRLIHRRKSQ